MVREDDHHHTGGQREERLTPTSRKRQREQHGRRDGRGAIALKTRLAEDLDQEQQADETSQQDVPVRRDQGPQAHVPTVARRPESRHRSRE
jgi:hypothetical protein